MSEPPPTPDEIRALPPDGGKGFNRLVFEASPYLLQHCTNPVDWYPWGEEAFARAKAENLPVFLSIGYSTCHWCHVMERESFERGEVAEVLNRLYVAIKVDREERPDLDEIYMAATQMMTGRGGWPMSVWLTPEGEPFFAGTYYPREDRVVGMHPTQGPIVQPGFIGLLERLAQLWSVSGAEARTQARQISEAISRHVRLESTPADVPGDVIQRAVVGLRQSFDSREGGFGGPPKFPPHGALRLLLALYERTGEEGALDMAVATLRAMARGGMHDHVGGGFHRYATDDHWFLPHFEKMLYDNAQLGRAYVDAYRLTGDDGLRLVAEGLYRWVLRDMTDEAGGFHSALDADSEGEEGTFYVWTPDEVESLLGADRAGTFCRVYGVEADGNWVEEASREPMSTSILHMPVPLSEAAEREGMTPAELEAQLATDRETLYAHRCGRIWPHRDDKVLTSWNGLMIGSLAYAGDVLGRPDYLEAAGRAARFLLGNLWCGGRLLATYRAGDAKLNAYLDDHAFVADGLLDLHAATGDVAWLQAARDIADVMVVHFEDAEGGFFFTSDDHERLLVRSKSAIDRAIPSGNGVAARLLARLGSLTGEAAYQEAADRTLRAFSALMERIPRACESLLLAHVLSQPKTGQDAPGQRADAMLRAAPVTVEVDLASGSCVPGGSVDVICRLTVDDGFHVQAHRAALDHLIATAIMVSGSDQARLEDVAYPPGDDLQVGEDVLSVYGGTVTVTGRIAIDADAAPGPLDLEVVIRYQPCDASSCQRPHTARIPIRLSVGQEPATSGG